MKSLQSPSAGHVGSRSFLSRSSSGVRATNEPVEAATFDSLVGRKVWTRWPEDNSFYEAVITDYNAAEVCFGVCEFIFQYLHLKHHMLVKLVKFYNWFMFP